VSTGNRLLYHDSFQEKAIAPGALLRGCFPDWAGVESRQDKREIVFSLDDSGSRSLYSALLSPGFA
jgi:hypothetical protein